ncbi:MAG TPA: aminopeptidase P N-terminal domain-containing protein [Nevskiaceae bacterium]|nr:aminopeptidase P N-terminal domain-containing protein [Nevskiaceae bacterium]
MSTARDLKETRARRSELMRRIGRAGIAIIPAAHEVTRWRDTHYRFRQASDFAYLTGFPEPEAVAVLAPGRRNAQGEKAEYLMFVRPRDVEREIWDGRRAGPEGVKARYGVDEAWPLTELEAQLPGLLAGRETVHMNLGEFPAFDPKVIGMVRHLQFVSRRGAAAPVRFEALETTLHEMRLIKRPAELALMRHAARITAQAHVKAMQATRPGRNEWEIAAVIGAEFELHDLQPGYGTICGGGANACILHYTENNQPLREGDLLLIDAGGEYRGYTADITRTFPVSGRFSAAQKAVYEVVLAANLAAIKTLRPGVSVGKPHEVATRVLTEGMVALGLLKGEPKKLIEQGRQRQFFMHGTGHWLGMDVHDVGRYKLGGEYRRFEPGMVMTVEPGIYVAPGTPGVAEKFWGIGIRIEDDVVVTEQGPEVLTAGVPKTVSEIEALMARRH